MAHRIDFSTFVFRTTLTLLALITLILLIAPTAVVVIVSFTDSYSLKFPPQAYSTRWYVELWDASQLHFAALNSIKVGLMTTLLSVFLGVSASLAISNSRSYLARIFDSLFMSPLVLPALAFGFGALMTFSAVGWSVSLTTLLPVRGNCCRFIQGVCVRILFMPSCKY